MGKRIWLIAVMVALAVMLTACESAEKLTKTLDSSDGNFTFSVPDSWDYNNKQDQEGLVLQMTNDEGAHASVYFYDNTVYDYPADDAISYLTEYYGDNIIGEVQEEQVADYNARRFEYNMVDLDEEENEADFHGYEYIIDTPYGVIEVDAYYSQDKVMGKIFKPSESQLELLRNIVQSLKINE